MKQKLPLYQVDAFTSKLFGGNPAAVVSMPYFLSNKLMQRIARENNLSETAFVVPDGKDAFKIRWFTPTKEVRLCGHATLAAAHVIFTHTNTGAKVLSFRTKGAGTLTVSKKRNQKYTIDLPADQPKNVRKPSVLKKALGLEPTAVLKGQDDLLVILEDIKQVRQLSPDFHLLSKIKKRGIIVSAPGRGTDFVSRCFYPRYGINEDPVTGSAHTLLTPYWAKKLKKKRLKASQLSKRKGKLSCRLKEDRVLLTGQAVTYLVGEIQIEGYK